MFQKSAEASAPSEAALSARRAMKAALCSQRSMASMDGIESGTSRVLAPLPSTVTFRLTRSTSSRSNEQSSETRNPDP